VKSIGDQLIYLAVAVVVLVGVASWALRVAAPLVPVFGLIGAGYVGWRFYVGRHPF
jgi:hypothetical protein